MPNMQKTRVNGDLGRIEPTLGQLASIFAIRHPIERLIEFCGSRCVNTSRFFNYKYCC